MQIKVSIFQDSTFNTKTNGKIFFWLPALSLVSQQQKNFESFDKTTVKTIVKKWDCMMEKRPLDRKQEENPFQTQQFVWKQSIVIAQQKVCIFSSWLFSLIAILWGKKNYEFSQLPILFNKTLETRWRKKRIYPYSWKWSCWTSKFR